MSKFHISREECQQIRDRAGDWKKPLDRLVLALMAHLQGRCGLEALPGLPEDIRPAPLWGCHGDPEMRQDLVSQMIRRYLQRAQGGTLFVQEETPASWEEAQQQLASNEYIRHQFRDLARKSRRLPTERGTSQGRDPDDVRELWDIVPLDRRDSESHPRPEDGEEPMGCLELRPDPVLCAGDAKIDLALRIAGLQLFPHVDWQKPEHRGLQEDLSQQLLDEHGQPLGRWEPCVDLLAREHASAQERWEQALEEASNDRLEKTRTQGSKLRRKIELTLFCLPEERTWMPLGSGFFRQHMGWSRSQASKWKPVYREWIRKNQATLVRTLKDDEA